MFYPLLFIIVSTYFTTHSPFPGADKPDVVQQHIDTDVYSSQEYNYETIEKK